LLLGSKSPSQALKLNKRWMALHNEACMRAKTISKAKNMVIQWWPVFESLPNQNK
jgi:hypothetical protein